MKTSVASNGLPTSTRAGSFPVLPGDAAAESPEREMVLAALRVSEERFQQLADAMPQIVWTTRPDGTADYFNRRWYDFTGLPAGDDVGESWKSILHPDDLPNCLNVWATCIRTGEPYQIEYRFKEYRTGEYRWQLARALPARDEAGQIVRWFGTCTDIEHQKRTEEALRLANLEMEERVRLRTAELTAANEQLHQEIAKRRQAEAELSLTSVRLSAVLNAATEVAIIAADMNGLINVFNTGAERMLGYSAAEMVGKQTPAIFHCPAEVAAHGKTLTKQFGVPIAGFEVFVAHARHGGHEEREWTYIRKDGTRLTVSLAVTAKRDAQGYIFGFLGVARDLTWAKQAEALQRQNEERHRLLVEGVKDYAIFMLDSEGHVLTWNLGAERIKGYKASEIVGKHFSIFYPPEEIARRKPWNGLDTAAKSGKFEEEGWRLCKDGSRLFAHVLITAIHDLDGGLQGFSKVTRDLTERRAAEEAFRQSEERFRSAFESAAIGMALIGPDGRWLQVNRTLCALVGYSHEELLAMNFQAITHPDDVASDLDRIRRAVTGEITTYQVEKRYLHKDGHVVWVQVSVSLLRDSKGQALHLIAQIQDINAHKQAEDRLREQARELRASLLEKEILLKEIHHRVKNNLQIVSTLLDLQSDQISDPQAVALFQESRGRVHSMALIHERLYRSDNLALVNMAEYVDRLTEDLLRSYQASSGDVGFVVAVEMALFPIDLAIPCGLLLNELLTNCLKHAFKDGRDGTIEIDLRPGDGSAVLTVTDDGCGFAVGFDFRNSTSFGLQLVIMLVEQLNGVIALDTNAKSCFTITFPVTN